MHFPRSLIAATIAVAGTFSSAQAQSQASVEKAYQMALGCAGTLANAARPAAKAKNAARTLGDKMGQSRAKTDDEIWQTALIYAALRRDKPTEFNRTLENCLKLGFAG